LKKVFSSNMVKKWWSNKDIYVLSFKANTATP
jgi:hypothetical protein